MIKLDRERARTCPFHPECPASRVAPVLDLVDVRHRTNRGPVVELRHYDAIGRIHVLP
jgi:hypothetical protein